MRQLALPFIHRAPLCVTDILAAPSNEAARSFLAADPDDWPQRRLFLWGPPGCGKTHLLHRWAARADAALVEAATISRIAADGVLPAANGLAIDDADQVHDETAFLHVLNVAAEHGAPLVLAARTSPHRWQTGLPDLASRLRAILTVAITPPEDDLLDALLTRLLADRQLAAPPAIIRYLRQRLPREPDALARIAARLDAASLEGRRPITVALASTLLDETELR